MSCSCKTLDDYYFAESIASVAALYTLEQVKRHLPDWITTYRCTECGQLWEERYEATGHGEVPCIEKVIKMRGS